LILAVSILVQAAVPALAATDRDPTTKAALQVQEVMDYIYHHHIDKPEPGQLSEGAITGMLERLNDPYTEYLSEDILKEYKEMLDGDFVGVGLRLQENGQYPQVIGLIDNSPASHSDIKPGDFIIKVNGNDIADMFLDEVVAKIRGPEGTAVTLTLRRDSLDIEVILKRTPLTSPTVDSSKLSGNIGYIVVHSFGSQTADEFSSELDGLVSEGVKGIVVDLRNTPGGYLQAAVDIAGNFLQNKSIVVTTEDRDSNSDEYRSQDSVLWNGPLMILMNEYTASASEVLAGALQDYGKAVLLGDTSYGKGVVQSIIPLESGGALKLTTARYLTPRGRSINGIGLIPDVRVQTRELQLIMAKNMISPAPETVIKFSLKDKTASVNGEQVPLQESAYRAGGVVYVPLRFAMEALGYSVSWNEDFHSIDLAKKNVNIQLSLNSDRAVIAGRIVALQAPVTTREGFSYIPLTPSFPGITVVDRNEEVTLVQAGRE
jgi:carboxyl-terminal processing protease